MIRWIALDSCALMPFDIAGSTAGSSQNFASPLAQTTCTWTRASSREKKNRYGPSLNTVGLTCVSILKGLLQPLDHGDGRHVGVVGEAKAGRTAPGSPPRPQDAGGIHRVTTSFT